MQNLTAKQSQDIITSIIKYKNLTNRLCVMALI